MIWCDVIKGEKKWKKNKNIIESVRALASQPLTCHHVSTKVTQNFTHNVFSHFFLFLFYIFQLKIHKINLFLCLLYLMIYDRRRKKNKIKYFFFSLYIYIYIFYYLGNSNVSYIFNLSGLNHFKRKLKRF